MASQAGQTVDAEKSAWWRYFRFFCPLAKLTGLPSLHGKRPTAWDCKSATWQCRQQRDFSEKENRYLMQGLQASGQIAYSNGTSMGYFNPILIFIE